MRKFSSYGPVDTELHYYVPRQELIDFGYQQLLGENPEKGGHYITVWAPRQRGKTWVMQQVLARVQERDDFEAAYLVLQEAKHAHTEAALLAVLVNGLRTWFNRDFPTLTEWRELSQLFTAQYFNKPLILILDEFDALPEEAIGACANIFRHIYLQRLVESHKISTEKHYRLHGLALIGVRAVLGVENVSGSPFNVQRSMHIPNLTEAEVNAMYHWYERESGQIVKQAVIDRVFYETQGQPGLVSWFGELLTETYNEHPDRPITLAQFEEVYAAAIYDLPNNNVLNIISKARQTPYQEVILDLFRTRRKLPFTYDDPLLNHLYLHGVIDREPGPLGERYVKFACPFVQKRLFNYFARTLFRDVGPLYDPFDDLRSVLLEDRLSVVGLLRCYERYLHRNREWLLRDVPRRSTDLRIYEAVYHFNLYAYLEQFLQQHGGLVRPEFPTGNGKVDLLLEYAGKCYAIEVKSFGDMYTYREALQQAARYARQLGLDEITLALFIDTPVDDANRAKYEAVYVDAETGVTVQPVFVEIVE